MALPAPVPADEAARLAVLDELALIGSPPELAYDEIVRLTARLLGVPTAVVNFVDDRQQWAKAAVGMRHGETHPLEESFCARAIASGETTMVVRDASTDPRFTGNAMVRDGLRFYAGARVTTADGVAVGTLCVADTAARELTDDDRATLQTLAAAVSAQVELARQRARADARAGELAAVLEHAPDAFVSMRADGTIIEWNTQAEHLFGWRRDEVLGRAVGDVLVPDGLRAAHDAGIARVLDTGDSRLASSAVEVAALHRDGTTVPVELSIAAVPGSAGVRFNAFARDISERLARDRERQEETDALSMLAGVTSRLAAGVDDDELGDEICAAACRIAGADQAVLFAPRAGGGLGAAGASRDDLRGLLIAEGDRSLALEAFTSGTPCFAGDAGVQGWPLAARHGARALLAQPVRVDRATIGVLTVFWTTPRAQLGHRVSRLVGLLAHEAATAFARSALFARLAEQSRTDGLTGVLNRRALDEELRLAVVHAARDEQPLSVAVLDLDHFKAYNDAHGHPAGDALLKACCAAWSASLRGDDVLARMGGEEFVVLLPGCAAPDARALTDRLRRHTPGGQTCSAGVATWDGAEAVGDLLERADRALYRAKAQGRDVVCAG